MDENCYLSPDRRKTVILHKKILNLHAKSNRPCSVLWKLALFESFFTYHYAGINLTGYHPPRAPRGFCTKMYAQPQGFCITENARGPGQ